MAFGADEGTDAEEGPRVRSREGIAEQRIGEGIDPDLGDAAHETFGALAEWWIERFSPILRSKSFAGYVRRHVIPRIVQLHLRQLRPHHIEALLDDLQHEKGLNPKSCNVRACINRVFTLAAERGRWQGPNPVAQVKRRAVPKRRPPPILRSHEVPVFLAAAGQWRPLLACAVWMGLRRGEVLALRKQDMNLEDRTMVIGRSHGADTTKGGHADVLPIPKPLVPYLVQAMKESDSELLFSQTTGEQRSPHFDLKAVVKRTMVRAGLVEKYVLHCRGWKCGHREEAPEPVSKSCPRCSLQLWSKPIPRDVGFHGLRHSTATLLLKAKVPYAIVQRIMRHRDPRLTIRSPRGRRHADRPGRARRGHGASASGGRGSLGPRKFWCLFGTKLGGNQRAGARPQLQHRAGTRENQWALQDSNLGPIGYEPMPESVQRFAAAAKSSFSLGTEGPTQSNPSQRNGEIRKKFVPSLSPTFRRITVGADHLLCVREVAARLGVSTATVYKLCERGELPHVRVSNAIRIAPADLEAFCSAPRHTCAHR